jgi:hypothetical protein
MGGGSTPSTQVQQTTQSNGPPSYIQPYLQGGIQDLTNLYKANPKAPAYYPGQTVASPSAATQSAIQTLFQRGANGSPEVRAGKQFATDTVGGKYLDIGNNPYFQKALAAGFEPQTREFNSSILPGVDARFSGAGRYGSNSHLDNTGMALDSLTRAQANAAATASNAAYTNERSNQLTAAGLLPGFAAADYQDINAMGQAGQALDQQSQAQIDSNIARYNYDQNAQWNYINRYLASLNGGYPGGESRGTVYGSAQPSSNPSESILGGILGVGGLALKAAPLFGLSDERLKEDITPVGKLKDGQTVYSYRFKGDPRTQIGLLAHEVERVHPDAVAKHPSGYRMVDYRRATAASAPGGLL